MNALLETLDISIKLIAAKSGMKLGEAIALATGFTGQTCGTLYNQLSTRKIGEYARALEIGEKYGFTLLTKYLNWPIEKARRAINSLVYNYPSHRYVIDNEELSSLGVNAILVDNILASIFKDIIELYKSTKGNQIEMFELNSVDESNKEKPDDKESLVKEQPKIKGKK